MSSVHLARLLSVASAGESVLFVSRNALESDATFRSALSRVDEGLLSLVQRAYGAQQILFASGGRMRFVTKLGVYGQSVDRVFVDRRAWSDRFLREVVPCVAVSGGVVETA